MYVCVCVGGGGYRGIAESWLRSLSVLLTITNFHLPDIPTHAYNHVTVHGMPDKARVLAKYEVLRLVRKTVQMYSFLYSGSSGTVRGVKHLQPETYIF